MKVVRSVKLLAPLVRSHPLAIPGIIGLGVLSSLSEGIGISLFIPLFHTLSVGTAGRVGSGLMDTMLVPVAGWIPPERRLLILAALIVAAIILKNIFFYFLQLLSAWVNSRVGHGLRLSIFKQLLNVRYDYLAAQEPGKLLNTLASESWRTSDAFKLFLGMIANVCTIVVFAVLLLVISWPLTLFVVLCLLVVTAVVQLATRRIDGAGRSAVTSNQGLTERMLAAISSMRVIRVFGNEVSEGRRFESASESVRRSFFKLDLLASSVHPISETMYAAVLVGILLVGLRQQEQLPSLLVFALVLFRLLPQVKEFDDRRVRLIGLGSAVSDVMSFIDQADKPYMDTGRVSQERMRTGIELDHVTFRYAPDGPPAVDDLCASIPYGRVTLLAGPSGAGKTTLVNLVCRLYDPDRGEIRTDGRPLPEVRLDQWRDRIALAGQDAHLFHDTVRANIAYGRSDAPDEEIVETARWAAADEFIRRLPEGYRSKVGAQGTRLSGGERQRIAIARAFLRDSDILILDEATNELDSLTEHAILERIRVLAGSRAVLVVAHRLSLAELADRIIVMDGGKIAESGGFRELIELDGLFAKLYRRQRESPSLEDHVTG